MRKTAGFTLIELVIVIVILGILGAVAAPKFLNLQGDAYGANVNALKSSIQSATTLGNTKAILDGKDNGADQTVNIDDAGAVKFVHGYPKAAKDGILALIDITENTDYTVVDNEANTDFSYNVKIDTAATPNTLEIFPSARFDNKSNCGIIYSEATSSAKATIVSENDC